MSDNKKPEYNSADDLLNEIERAIGHTFKEFDVNKRLDNRSNKGKFGHIVEEGIFKYPINSNPEPDFEKLGIELKVTGVLKSKDGSFHAKERLSIDSLNYTKIVQQEFNKSELLKKLKTILFVIYEYVRDTNSGDFKIVNAFINEFDEEDLAIIENDYNRIRDFVLRGEAHNLSENMNDFLVPSTTGSGHGEMVKQPFSDVLAKPRRFALKKSFIDEIIRKNIYGKTNSYLFRNKSQINSLEYLINAKLSSYFGKSKNELCSLLGISTNSKSVFRIIVNKIFGVSNINNSDEFKKGDFQAKVIRIEENGKIRENVSFPYFDYFDIADSTFEESDFYQTLVEKTFVFIVFKKKKDEYFLEKCVFYKMPLDIIENYGASVFNRLKNILKNGNIVKCIKTNSKGKIIRYNNFPKSSENEYFHIRPHGQDSSDVLPLPVKDKLTGEENYTKQCFWINSRYLKDIIK